jgi:mannose-1-phosphate guanylyltransferase
MLHAVIMAGGSGTRFWPASRERRPKQLLALTGDRSMLQQTVDRLEGLVPPHRIWIVTNERLVAAVAEQLPELPAGRIVGEPCKRDTAPCIGLAAWLVQSEDPQATMVVTPADHVIRPAERFQEAVARADELVQEDAERLVTFGIRPSYPAEAFGYIERGEPIGTGGVYRVNHFREKPSREIAQQYLQAGCFYWNAGIFVWRAAAILKELARYEPEMCRRLDAIGRSIGRPEFPQTLSDQFGQIRGKSIDYAVMEKADKVLVMEAPFQWDDVGSWQAMARLQDADANGNTSVGRVVAVDSQNCILFGSPDHLIATLGVRDLIVVHTGKATLVMNRSQEEHVRRIVSELQERAWTEFL